MPDKDPTYLNGRGSQSNPHNRFFEHALSDENPEGIDEYDDRRAGRTKFIEIHPKTIVNEIKSPDLNMFYSLNPYQGCEHGCTYCYARPTHEYWGYSAGVDFERVILVKKNAPELLKAHFDQPAYARKVKTLSISGNTDCYQPCERELGLTRKILEICRDYKHPISIITKNALVMRDLDILSEMAREGLAHVNMSVTTVDETLRRKLEPRTATIAQRLKAIQALSEAGVPVNVMVAPIIPALNDHEIFRILEAVSKHGARTAQYQVVRLNGPNGAIFTDWLERNFPDRAAKVISQISDTHGGKLNDSRFGTRMKGEGLFAATVKRQFEIARSKYLREMRLPPLRTDLFRSRGQLSLFD